MRLIDADKLKQHFEWWGDDDPMKEIFDRIIDQQPTVEIKGAEERGLDAEGRYIFNQE